MPRNRNPAPPGTAEEAFAVLYRAHSRDVLAFAVRRAPTPEDAADVVAETFLVAWRRADEVPAGDAARLWLFGVARRALANHRRGERRRSHLSERIRAELPAALAAAAPPAPALDGDLAAALAALPHDDREVLLLTAWEDLTPTEIAAVLGISALAARSRLHRARRRIRRALTVDPAVPACSIPLELEETR